VTVNIDRTQFKRIVIRAPNWLGDAVMALPAMAAVRAAFPDATLAVAAVPAVAPMFEEHTSAAQDELLVVPNPRREAADLAERRFDAMLLMPNSFRTAWASRRAGIAQRWGYAGNLRTPLLTRSVPRPRGRVHQSTYYLELVRGLGIDAADIHPRVAPRESTRARARQILEQHIGDGRPIVGLAPGAAYGHAKRWPPDRMAALAVRLTRERNAACVLVGAAADREAGREIESAMPPDVRVATLIGRTALRLLIGILAHVHGFVSNDSGAMHLAAGVGVPVTALFGPTDERVTAPIGDHDVLIHQVFCRPCMLRDCPIDHRCMKGIPVAAAFDAVNRRLEAR
jgi:heptosyltransferase II